MLLLLAGATIWTLHFIVAYVLIAFGCSAPLRAASIGGASVASLAVIVTTSVALLAELLVTHRAHQQRRAEAAPTRVEVEGSLTRFFAWLGVWLNGFFAFTIVFEGAAALVLRACS